MDIQSGVNIICFRKLHFLKVSFYKEQKHDLKIDLKKKTEQVKIIFCLKIIHILLYSNTCLERT